MDSLRQPHASAMTGLHQYPALKVKSRKKIARVRVAENPHETDNISV